MAIQRPLECPACGHDRIVQRPHELYTETGQMRVRVTKWLCGLCSYQWNSPALAARIDEWERA